MKATTAAEIRQMLAAMKALQARAGLGGKRDLLGHYCPHVPSPKQQCFLGLICQEALYGGAAGGGKSDALLMAALQYVHVPGYAALILRRDTARLNLAGAIIPRSHQWLADSGATWLARDRRWSFPTGGAPATISFGYLRDSADKYRYGSSEYQYIAFDELTELPEEDYLFLFSRLRKTHDLNVPLRVRGASNPGGVGHLWVRERFLSDEALAAGRERFQVDLFWKEGRAFVPAQLSDNPALDAQSYRASLDVLPPVLREQLLNGDWSVRERGIFRAEWLRYFRRSGGQCELLDASGRMFTVLAPRGMRRFATVDPAGTSADKARERRGQAACWSVIQVWEQPWGEQSKYLLLRHQWRERVGFNVLCSSLRQIHAEWQPERIYIENEKLGVAAVDLLGDELPLETIATGGRDKVARAASLISKLEAGEVFLPRDEAFVQLFETELLAWTGDDREPNDQIDAASYAAGLARERQSGIVRLR